MPVIEDNLLDPCGPGPFVTVPGNEDPQDSLERRLVETIQREGPLRFDAYMEAVLYDSEYGYYAGRGAGVRTGGEGDFVTAPTLSPVFASAFARFVHAAWKRLGEPRDWLLVEPGGGTGEFLTGVVEGLEALDAEAVRGLRLALVDSSPAHRDQADRALRRVLRGSRVEVSDRLPVFDAPGVILANELLDNLPVRLLAREEGTWWERVVDVSEEGRLRFRRIAAPQDLVDAISPFNVPVPDHHQVEVPVGAQDWIRELTRCVGKQRGVMALVDYGETARDLLGEPRPWGTVLAYEAQERDRDVLVRPGKRDVTAHVNWSMVGRIARGQGWDVVGYTNQFGFLSSMGALDEAVRLAQEQGSVEAIARLSELKEVLLPGGMGEAMKVIVLSRGLEGEDAGAFGLENLKELDPPARGPPPVGTGSTA